MIAIQIGVVGDLRSIRRPSWRVVTRCIVGKLDDIATIRMHHVKLIIAIYIRSVGDLRSIRRPRRIPVTRCVVGKLDDIATISVPHINLKIAIQIGAVGELPVAGLLGLMVADDEAERARQLIAEYNGAELLPGDEPESYPGELIC